MQNMIREYERSRTRVMTRIHELNAQLRDDTLRTRERELLEQRRELLTVESIELLRIIAELRSHH